MALVRVYLLTYRRPHLLKRALTSLLAQTFRDWVCEVHNDDPDDPYPAKIIDEFPDSRVFLCQHVRNLGPTASFNIAFEGGPEPYVSILEDDNWWEPSFLAEAIQTLADDPNANVVWSNMRIWNENRDGSWSDTRRTIWPSADGCTRRCFSWPNTIQAVNALHSNGAMVVRSSVSRKAKVPIETPFAIIEHLRERLIPGNWILLTKPLANFAVTCQTARGSDRAEWARAQALIAASFFATSTFSAKNTEQLWQLLRKAKPPSTGVLFLVGLSGIKPFSILRFASIGDWIRFFAGTFWRPFVFWKAVQYRRHLPRVWDEALNGAKARSHERHAQSSPEVFNKEISNFSGSEPQSSLHH